MEDTINFYFEKFRSVSKEDTNQFLFWKIQICI